MVVYSVKGSSQIKSDYENTKPFIECAHCYVVTMLFKENYTA